MTIPSFVHFDPLRIVQNQSCLCFDFASGQISLTGSGCGGLGEGWRAEFLFSGFSPILVLQLAHASGVRSVWYVSSDGSRLAGSVNELDDRNRQLLRNTAAKILRAFTRSLIEDIQPNLRPLERDFLKLDRTIRVEIFELVKDLLLPAPEVRLAERELGVTPVVVGRDMHPATLRHNFVSLILRQDFQAVLVSTLQAKNNAFGIPSPVTGKITKVQASLCFDDFHFAYKFFEEDYHFSFYLIAGYEVSEAYCLYFPEPNLLVCLPDKSGLSRIIAEHISTWIAKHFIYFASEYVRYLQSPIAGVTSLMRAPPWTHIGHQLWNELTGIDNFLEKSDPASNLDWIVPDGGHAVEFYGRIDDLFPQLRNKTVRGLCDATDVIQHIYSNNRLAIRLTQDFVSANLRSRVLNHAISSTPIKREIAYSLKNMKGPVILLGLRVENRTLIDLGAFYQHCIARILACHPEARFVIDGYNIASPGGCKHKSHGERGEDLLAVVKAEQGIVELLEKSFGEGVIIRSVGLMVPESLQIIDCCDFFVSLWGAGLAKYRWICNKPGFIITSRWNLAHRSDLRIYDDPSFLENPTPVYWIDPALVTDHPEVSRMVSAGTHPQWSNFSIQEDAVIDRILETLTWHFAGP